jgi:hypothetical protein
MISLVLAGRRKPAKTMRLSARLQRPELPRLSPRARVTEPCQAVTISRGAHARTNSDRTTTGGTRLQFRGRQAAAVVATAARGHATRPCARQRLPRLAAAPSF